MHIGNSLTLVLFTLLAACGTSNSGGGGGSPATGGGTSSSKTGPGSSSSSNTGTGGMTQPTTTPSSTCPSGEMFYYAGNCDSPDGGPPVINNGCYAECFHEGTACPTGGTCASVIFDSCLGFTCPETATCSCAGCEQILVCLK